MPVMQQMLGNLGFSQITLNDNPEFKDHAYGYSAYNVSRSSHHPLLWSRSNFIVAANSSSMVNGGDL